MTTTLADPFEPDDDVDRAYLDWLQANLFGPDGSTDTTAASTFTVSASDMRWAA